MPARGVALLQWHQMPHDAPGLGLPAPKTQTKLTVLIPVSKRVTAILGDGSAGTYGVKHAPTAYVFGNQAGEAVTSFKRA